MLVVKAFLVIPGVIPGLAALLSSCSDSFVFENREDCPCWLRFELVSDGGCDHGNTVLLSIIGPDGALWQEASVDLGTMVSKKYHLAVDRGMIRASGLINLKGEKRSGSAFIIPEGSAADSLYYFTGTADATGEDAVIPVTLHKEHSKIKVSFRNDEPGEYPYYIKFRSTSAGIDLMTGKPVDGRFLCTPGEESPAVFRSVLPRQGHSEDLVLEIWAKDSNEAESGLVDEIPLDVFISEIEDFSWSDVDLKDLYIHIDYARALIGISVQDWEEGTVFSLDI